MTDILEPALAGTRLTSHAAVEAMQTVRVATPASRSWMLRYRLILLASDVVAIGLATIIGYTVRFAGADPTLNYDLYAAGLVLGWLVAMQGSGAYDIRHLATGPTEAKVVLRASGIAISVMAVYCYATKTEVARGFVVGVVPVGVALLLLGRGAVRHTVGLRRRRGDWVHRILAVGTADSVRHLAEVTQRATGAGLRIVGACVEDAEHGSEIAPGVPVVGGIRDAADTASQIDADVVAVTGSGLGPTSVRELGWELEGSGRGLVLAPALTEIAGPRVHVSPVEGLPLVWVEQPQLGRIPRLVKRTVDLAGGLFLLALAIPVLFLAACAIKIDSRGPIFYRQRRLGVHGTEFGILKLRTMVADAEEQREQILELNEQDGAGVLFKIRRDPRVTRVGRLLRRFSIDELPQLLHVVSGRMALVGPRPLAAIDSTYTGAARRRLLVRPGLTGLWQVSGRSELSWDDAVRLDLYYVENWSLSLDLSILARTVLAVLRRTGAY